MWESFDYSKIKFSRTNLVIVATDIFNLGFFFI